MWLEKVRSAYNIAGEHLREEPERWSGGRELQKPDEVRDREGETILQGGGGGDCSVGSGGSGWLRRGELQREGRRMFRDMVDGEEGGREDGKKSVWEGATVEGQSAGRGWRTKQEEGLEKEEEEEEQQQQRI